MSAKDLVLLELSGGPLSDSQLSGLPKLSYVSAIAGIALLAFVEATILQLGNEMLD